MASNYNRKSASSASRRGRSADARRSASARASRTARAPRSSASRVAPRSNRPSRNNPRLTSVRVGDLNRASRIERVQGTYRRYLARIAVLASLAAALVVGGAVLYSSSTFSIENIEVNGVEHLTSDEMSQLAAVPAGSTLLRIDTGLIEARLEQNAWVQDATVKRAFPNTLQIDVVERTVAAVVEIPTADAKTVKSWAVSSDHIWLMPIPEKGSAAAASTSARVYEDTEGALHITDVPYGTQASIGRECTDGNVVNALDIVYGMTTALADQVKSVSAAGPDETVLMLDNGVEIAFGKAENIRDKERVVLKILEENEGSVAYINVRSAANPTWRAV